MAAIDYIQQSWNKFRNNLLLRRLLTVLSLDVLVKASAFILLPVYLRLMTQDQYGIFNYIISIVYSFSVFLNLGLYISQSKLYHDYTEPAERGRLLYAINVLLVTGLLVIVVPVYLLGLDYKAVSFLFKNAIDYPRYRWWILCMSIVALFAFMLTNYFYTSENIRDIRKYSLWRMIGINVVSVGALFLFRKQDAVLVRFIVISVVECLLLIIFYPVYLRKIVAKVDQRIFGLALRIGLPFMLSSVFNFVITFGDKFFLEKYAPVAKLSVYYLAFSCSSVITILSNSLQNVWLPLFFQEKDLAKNIQRTKKIVKRLLLALLGISVAITAAVIVFLYFGVIPKNYNEIIYLLPVFLASQIILCVALLYSNYLTYFNKTPMVLWAGLFVSLLSVGLNMVLVPLYKVYGAAGTALVSNTCYLLIYFGAIRYYSKKHLDSMETKSLLNQ